jgi:hypothetical protein
MTVPTLGSCAVVIDANQSIASNDTFVRRLSTINGNARVTVRNIRTCPIVSTVTGTMVANFTYRLDTTRDTLTGTAAS